MTFKDYLNQENPKLRPDVIVTAADCESIFPSYATNSMLISLKIHGEIFLYVMYNESDHLYTMDEDGNKNKLSCFRFKKD